MEIFREGRLRNSDLKTGNILSLELHELDIENLLRPRHNRSGIRFMQCKQWGLGWAPEDKASVSLKDPKERFNDENGIANLALDPGGDLYFTIWNSPELLVAKGCEVFDDLSTFITSDPSLRIHHLGIEVVRMYGLDALAGALRDVSGSYRN